MHRPAVVFAAVLVAAAVSASDGLLARPSAQRTPASRDEALAVIRQIAGLIDGNTRDNPSLSTARKLLIDFSATVERLLGEFDDAGRRADANYAAIAPALTLLPGDSKNACERMTAGMAGAARANSDVAAGRTAIGNLILDTAVPLTTCRATDPPRLRAATRQLVNAKEGFLASVTQWALSAQEAEQARWTLTSYRNALDALGAMEDASARLTDVVRRAERGWSDYELWTITAAPQIAAIRKTAAAFGIEREVAELEAKALAASAEFSSLSLTFRKPDFAARLAAVMKASAASAARHESLKSVSPHLECNQPPDADLDSATVAAEVAGSIYRIDETNRSWLAAADKCERKKGYIEHIALERTFVTVRAGDTVPTPRFLQASSNVLADPFDVGARAEWSGLPTPFTPTAAHSNMIFFVTATIEGRASTMTIFVEPARFTRR